MKDTDRSDITLQQEKAILVGVLLPDSRRDANDPLRELRELARTAGSNIVGEMIQSLKVPRGQTYLGKGKVEQLKEMIGELEAGVVIFDNELSPRQIQSLEEQTSCKIIDRSELILDIFANRATTRQAQLQVEIAQLQYTAPRLRAMWSHLGQVTGGAPIGVGTRGPGEQQLEVDRRLVQQRLSRLKSQLEEVQARRTRQVQKRRLDHFTAGLVGYTNAGKSTLFNALTEGGAHASDRLFATLGTRVERWNLGGGNSAMLSDTVGFIRDLPHHLVASFRSTLEETIFAHVLLLVVDTSDSEAEQHLDTVRSVLDSIEADQEQIVVLNKIDRLRELTERTGAHLDRPKRTLEQWMEAEPGAIAVSATTGEGLDMLADRVLALQKGMLRTVRLTLELSDSRGVDFVEKRTEVIDREYVDGHVHLTTVIGRRQIEELLGGGSRVLIDGIEAVEALRRDWDPKPERATRIPPHLR